MYCKFCGNRIASNTTKCPSCGSAINLRDGGQSFFDDNELDAWQSDGIDNGGLHTSMPRTEMFEVRKKRNGHNKVHPKASYIKAAQTASRRKKKKTLIERLNLSRDNRLIMFCISSALVIVLIAVIIIANTRGDNDKEKPATNFTQQVIDTYDLNNEKNVQKLKEVTIKKSGVEVPHEAPIYMKDEKLLYVSLDQILKDEYVSEEVDGRNGITVIYSEKGDGENYIKVTLGSNELIVKNSDGEETEELDGETFVTGNKKDGMEVYVAAESFLKAWGHENADYDEDEEILYYDKKLSE